MDTLIEYEPANGRLRALPAPRDGQPGHDQPGHDEAQRGCPPDAGITPTRQAHAARIQHVLRAVLEVLDGRRPVTQLRGLLSERAYASVLWTVRRRLGGGLRLHAMRTSRPSPAAVEVSLTVLAGRRFRAAAARLELRHELWLCTDFGLL